MNKRHDIVNSIFRLGKKDEILLKPSLCLKKILPEELKNMDKEIEREKSVKQKNFINVFGNQILSLYKREMERKRTNNSSDIKINRENILESKNNSMEQKEEIKNNNKSNDDNIDNDKNFNNNKKEINNNIMDDGMLNELKFDEDKVNFALTERVKKKKTLKNRVNKK